jgi:DNA polymerase
MTAQIDALSLLRMQIEWGADEALDDTPVNRLRAPSPAPATAARSAPRPPQPARAPQAGAARPSPGAPSSPAAARTPAAAPPSAAGQATPAARALAAAAQATSLPALRAAIAGFDGCALRETAANLVFAVGDPDSSLLLVGDPPGEAEDRAGLPFAGPDGALLDRMLASIGLTRAELLLAPLIPWRPPGGRPPSPAELALCLPFLHRLIALAAPRHLVLAGALAPRALMGATRRRAAPAWVDIAVPGVATPVPALAMPGPAMLVRTPAMRREAWAALRFLKRSRDGEIAGM